MKNLLMLKLVLLFAINVFGQTLKPGDGIKISFFNINDSIQGNYFVLDNGKIQLPYLGMLSTSGKDFSELRTEVINRYKQYYKNPELNIQPLYRIDIIGEVNNPGVYYLTGFETISDLIALAGGETNDSKIENIYLLRENSRLEIDLESFLKGENNLSDIGLESGDKVYVPRTWWVGARDVSVIVSGLAVFVSLASLFTN